MACKVCNKGIRIFYNGELQCPVCKGLKFADKRERMKQLKDTLQENLHYLRLFIKHSDYEDTLSAALNLRELAAKDLIENPDDEESAKIWLSCLFLLASMQSENHTCGDVRPDEILYLSRKTLETISRMELVEQDKIVYLESGEECVTELQILFRTSPEIDKNSFEAHKFTEPGGPSRFLETVLKSSMVEYLDAVQSDTLTRNFRTCLPKYLLPFNQREDIMDILSIALNLAAEIAFAMGSSFSALNGVLTVSKTRYDQISKQVSKNLGSAATDFLSLKMSNFEGVNLALHIMVFDSSLSEIKLPYYSLLLLTKICYRSVFSLVDYRTGLGESPEDWIHKLLTGYLKTTAPKTGEELLRLKLGKKLGDIDVAGYNDEMILLVESKFRETLNVQELEEELDKFERTLEKFEQIKSKYGFSKSQKIVPICYMPWPPFTVYGKHNITIIPSLATFIEFLVYNFPPITRPYAKPMSSIRSFLDNDHEDRLFVSDLSSYIDVEKDMYRIQDVQVESIEDNEVIATVFSPQIGYHSVIFDADEECLAKLRNGGVKNGTVLRLCVYNLHQYWTTIQIVDFNVLRLDSPFDPAKILTELNRKEYGKYLAHLTAGKNAEELECFVERNGIDLKRYIEWAKTTGHNEYAAVGNLLGRSLIPDAISYQCQCGEAVTLEEDVFKQLKKQYGDEMKCMKCDSTLRTKLEAISGTKLFSLPTGRRP